MKRIILICLLIPLFLTPSFGWSKEGHQVIAKIAENNLKPSVKKKIEKYLDGHSIVYVASWMDYYRSTPEYSFTTKWHTAPVNAELKYDDSLLDPVKGNAIYGLEKAIETLKDYRNLTDSTVAVNIKYIVHIVGDMHCPSHVKYTTYDVNYKVDMPKVGRITLHSLWDSAVIRETRVYSHTEWAKELDLYSKKQIKEVVAGTPRDWFHESAQRCTVQFDWIKPDETVSRDALNSSILLIEEQCLLAGYRLAHILNGIF